MASNAMPTVVIVGAGPAGASAAYVTASSGLRTVIAERRCHPRVKVCGEACTPRAVRILTRMGVIPALASGALEVRQVHLVSPGGIELHADLPQHVFGGRALVVPRALLDDVLVRRAVQAGAEIRQNTRVKGLHGDNGRLEVLCEPDVRINADIVIGCDGAPSMVRRWVGAKQFGTSEMAFGMRAVYENVRLPHPATLVLVWDRSVLPAYGWVFPLPSGRANVGIGVRANRLRPANGGLLGLFRRFIETARVREMLKDATLTSSPTGHALPLTPSPGACVFDRVLLAGDAAGLVNPLTGEGIDYALESGEFAGEIAVRAARSGSFDATSLAPYQRLCDATFGRVFRASGWLRHGFSLPWLLDRIFRAGNRSAKVRNDIASIALGAPGTDWKKDLVVAALCG